jgi:hypothetical protein
MWLSRQTFGTGGRSETDTPMAWTAKSRKMSWHAQPGGVSGLNPSAHDASCCRSNNFGTGSRSESDTPMAFAGQPANMLKPAQPENVCNSNPNAHEACCCFDTLLEPAADPRVTLRWLFSNDHAASDRRHTSCKDWVANCAVVFECGRSDTFGRVRGVLTW